MLSSGPEPGFTFTTFPISYMGHIWSARQVDVGVSIFVDIDPNVNTN